jgi:hypothetical protein
MSKRFASALMGAIFALFTMPAHAQSEGLPMVTFGDGTQVIRRASVLNGAHARPMSSLGPDAIRFTFDPGASLQPAMIFELERDADDATLNVIWLERGHSSWRPYHHKRIRMATYDYSRIAEAIDEEMTEGRALALRVAAGEETVICVDGYELLTERVRDGAFSWMDGDCGEQPNHAIRALLAEYTLEMLGD